MGAFATLTIPLDLSRPGATTLALAAAESSAGSADIAADRATNRLTMKLQLPGNVKSLMTRLKSAGFVIPPRIGVSVPVRSLGIPDMLPDIPHLLAELNATPYVADAKLEGANLTATTLPNSRGLYAIFWSLIHAGLIAQDTPTLVSTRGL